MTTTELLKKQLDDVGYQVEQVLAGIDETTADLKLTAGAMSPRETAHHLLECCYAAQAHLDGVQHQWGSLAMPDGTFTDLMGTYRNKRDEVVANLTKDENNEDALKTGTEYIVLHEAYHVGQMAQLRLEKTEGWDAYSIYR